MSTTTRDQGKAQEIARRVMAGWDIADLENLMTEHVSGEDHIEILSQIEPEYKAMEKESSQIRSELEKILKKKNRELFARYAEIRFECNMLEAQAGFHLGFAAALQLLGGQHGRESNGASTFSLAERETATVADLPSPKSKATLGDIVDEIIKGVDGQSFPVAFQPDFNLDHGIQNSGMVERFLTTAYAADIRQQVTKLLLVGAKVEHSAALDTECLLSEFESSHEARPAAIAYCAGLRAAAASKEQTRAAMLSFLRLYDEGGRS